MEFTRTQKTLRPSDLYLQLLWKFHLSVVVQDLPTASEFSFTWSVQHFAHWHLSMTSLMESSSAHGELPERSWLKEREKPLRQLSGMNACLASFVSCGEGRQEPPSLHVCFILFCSVVPVILVTRGQGLKGHPLHCSEMTACVLLLLSEAVWEWAKTRIALRTAQQREGKYPGRRKVSAVKGNS